MNIKKVKIEIYIPAEYTQKLREALNNIGALGVGNYDNVMSVTTITGYWRPLKGANPFDGKVNEISKATEDKVEFATDTKNIENIIKVMKEVHPYEEPIINIIPLLNDNFNVNLNY
ncbi:cytochrome C biogenesis protein [Brachyspira sp.]|uniref:cytochrome C biogenesis protein n=1 Tax=Brachyspira sp. TaxID=1977261 RepID=UPI002616A4B7|nr:cytochrome C biogenesis protein [Brachyspira sp.]